MILLSFVFFNFIHALIQDNFAWFNESTPVIIACAVGCGLGWRYFDGLIRKQRNIQELCALGLDDAEAISVAEQESGGGNRGDRIRQWWEDYYSSHRIAIDQLNREFGDIMMSRYHIRPEYLDDHDYPDGHSRRSFVSHLHRCRRSALSGATEIHQQLAKEKHVPKHIPTKQMRVTLISLGIAAMSIYGYAGSLFVPSDIWFACAATASIIAAAVKVLKFSAVTAATRGSKWKYPLNRIGLVVVWFYLCWGALGEGVGSAITALIGEQNERTFHVRTIETDIKGFKKYCFESDAFVTALGFRRSCGIDAEQYYKLPRKLDVSFKTKETPLGILLVDYTNPLAGKGSK